MRYSPLFNIGMLFMVGLGDTPHLILSYLPIYERTHLHRPSYALLCM